MSTRSDESRGGGQDKAIKNGVYISPLGFPKEVLGAGISHPLSIRRKPATCPQPPCITDGGVRWQEAIMAKPPGLLCCSSLAVLPLSSGLQPFVPTVLGTIFMVISRTAEGRCL